LAVCCTSLLIAGLDVTAVNVALPDIGRDLNASVSGLQWTIDGYTLAVAGLLMLAGSSADRIGRRRVFQAGLTLFTVGSLACSLASGLDWLIAFRIVQGLGASMLTPVALSILTDTFTDPRERTKAIGLWGGTFGLSLALGPLLGGLLVACGGWRSVFWINVPVGVAAIVAVAVLVPESRSENTPRPDPAGQALVLAALAAVTYAVIEGSHRGFGSILIIGLLALAAVATAALAGYEHRRHRSPIDPAFAGAALAGVAAFLALSGFLFLNTLYLQDVRGLSVLHAGLLTAPMAAAAAIVSPISGRLTAAYGPRMPLTAGGVVLSVAAALLTRVVPATGLPALVTVYALFGAGFGLVNAPITHTAVSGTPHVKADVSGAICSTARQIGSCLGVALLGSIATARSSAHGGYTAASHVGWWLLAGCGALIAGLAITTAKGHAMSAETQLETHTTAEAAAAESASHADESVEPEAASPTWPQSVVGTRTGLCGRGQRRSRPQLSHSSEMAPNKVGLWTSGGGSG
jgi:EmrB/QacA subfamily drug resistance transporter